MLSIVVLVPCCLGEGEERGMACPWVKATLNNETFTQEGSIKSLMTLRGPGDITSLVNRKG